ncbi:MAG: ABC transporter permease [Propionibacteriales bacterium]|nr:ABC transporter permease [Propionibacteriales bacterium]
MTVSTPTASAAAVSPRSEFRLALLAEWTKFRTLRSTYITLGLAVLTTIVFGALILTGAVLVEYDDMSPAERANFQLDEGIWFHGLHLGQVLFAVLGSMSVTGEYVTGTIRAALAAVPSRRALFAAKAVGLSLVTAVVGLVSAAAMFAIAQPILGQRDLDVPLTDASALQGVGLAALATVGFGLLGLGAGFLIRHASGATATVLLGFLGIPIIAQLLPQSWWSVIRYFPADAGWAMFTPTADTLSQGPATAVFFGYVAVVLAAAAVLFVRRDAGAS